MSKNTLSVALFITAAAALSLSGCATDSPTLGETLVKSGERDADLGKQWLRGQELVADGNELIEKGNEDIEKGNERVKKGNKRVDDGKEKIQKGNELVQEVERLRGPKSSVPGSEK